jgi:hypothetical protein
MQLHPKGPTMITRPSCQRSALAHSLFQSLFGRRRRVQRRKRIRTVCERLEQRFKLSHSAEFQRESIDIAGGAV